MSDFKDLNLIEGLLVNLSKAGYKDPTPIQEQAIPVLLRGSDLLGIAQTGTGKTASFALPIIQQLLTSNSLASRAPRALILTPTRELCNQINASFVGYGLGLGLRSCAVYGGVAQADQVSLLKEGIDIVVATPGRLLDLVERKRINLSKIEVLVLDEADRMLDLGFIDDIRAVVKHLPGKRQTVLFSATMPESVSGLAAALLRSPKVVEVTPLAPTVSRIRQRVIFCNKNHKFQLLVKILKLEECKLVLVFTRTKNMADNVVEYLAQNRLAAKAFHADKAQFDRERAFELFKEGTFKILVATDIASRGIDVDGVTHVINFELPRDVESYIHRIGRTGRAGKEGVAISLCDESEEPYLEKINQIPGNEMTTEDFVGKGEVLRFKIAIGKQVKAPTPGRSQEKSAYVDHSKRQPAPDSAVKRKPHPGFKKTKKKK
ncbi:MAG TPA: DEAD/DEAH box helicase [Bacteriovoracaceae bacterium]|nr:DEAD/DEAH box helicase [Bacteriovoracaceae bacterium]